MPVRSRSSIASILVLICALSAPTIASAEMVRHPVHLAPTGKGWAAEVQTSPQAVVIGNGINWYGGPVMSAASVNVYFIWYGNWTSGPKPSDSLTTVNLLNSLFGAGGIGGSPYELINTTYGDNVSNVSGNVQLAASYVDTGSQGTKLSDSKVLTVVSRAISNGKLPKDPNGIYFVLTSSNISETSGFCSRYCGWHTRATISGADIKYSFVGNSDRCPNGCEIQTISPNADSGADGMASVMAHEAEEMVSDPDLNAWFDSSGQENADKCAWKFGPTTNAIGHGAYNETFGGHNWMIQMNWENARGGGCDQTLGGTFY